MELLSNKFESSPLLFTTQVRMVKHVNSEFRQPDGAEWTSFGVISYRTSLSCL